MKTVIVCEKMGWTYQEYLEQPQFFINLILEKTRLDIELEKRELNKIQNGRS